MKEFDKRMIHYGQLYAEAEKLGDVRCEVSLNEIDTSDMKVVFSVFKGNALELMRNAFNQNGLNFKAELEYGSVGMMTNVLGVSLDSAHDEPLHGRIKEYRITGGLKEGNVKKIHIRYNLMPNALFRTEPGTITKHWEKGLLYGWSGRRKEFLGTSQKEEPEWAPVQLPLPSAYGEAKLLHNFHFYEEEKEGREYYLVTDVPSLQFIITDPRDNLESILNQIAAEVDIVLLALSFIQGDFIDWCYFTASAQDVNNDILQEVEKYQVARQIDEDSISDGYIIRNRQQLRATLCNVVSQFKRLSEKERKVCKESIDRCIVACRKDTIDTRLIYFHSCLDVLIKYYDKSDDPFSKRLLHVCKKLGIEWTDIYPELSEEGIENKKRDFQINALRNNMLHQGEYSEDFQLVMNETYRARGLTERIILKMLGINHHNSGLGQPSRL